MGDYSADLQRGKWRGGWSGDWPTFYKKWVEVEDSFVVPNVEWAITLRICSGEKPLSNWDYPTTVTPLTTGSVPRILVAYIRRKSVLLLHSHRVY